MSILHHADKSKMLTSVKPVQSANAFMSIKVTELGMVIDVNPVQPQNARGPIDVTEFGIVEFLQPTISVFVAVSIIALQLLRESYTLLPLSTTIDVIPEQ